MDNDSIRTTVGSLSEEMEPDEHSIDRKTNSANDTKHNSNDTETTSLDDRKNKTETPAPLLKTLDARDAHPDRENGAIENFDMTPEEMVRGGWMHGRLQGGITLTFKILNTPHPGLMFYQNFNSFINVFVSSFCHLSSSHCNQFLP